MNKTMRLNASELGVWKPTINGVRWSWLPTNPYELMLVDRQAGYGRSAKALALNSTFRLQIIESDNGYRVTTCGSTGKGATRHHEFKTNLEAQKYAIKWLDYRIAVCVV